ncbi:MAG: hypothetical protein PHU12_03145 [Candidatus Aenigmarchaeota archaeon]|nr:hypothetical protein [Candidatus Aenigmarchaeota archaeon]
MAGLETLILSLRESGFPLILLWLLTLSVSYGILSHVDIPKSKVARGVISIVAAFMVLFAAASGPAAVFIENIITSGIVIAFGLMTVIIFFEIAGAKSGKEHLFAKHPIFFGISLLILAILIFIGAGGLGILNMPDLSSLFTEPIIAILFFMVIMGVTVWVLLKEGGK